MSIGIITGQTKKVNGTVLSDEDGLPVIGASVLVKGTSMGTVTDIDGKFVLQGIPHDDATLVISYIGMKAVEVKAGPNLKVILIADAELLDEVVVTGYGTFKKSSFTGAASNLSTEKLQDVPALSLSSKLAGGVAGVQITSTSGQPGAVESVRIRGMGSMNASNEPLYVIDGIPMLSGNASGFSYSQGGSSLLSTLNSNDIESMTVIKDAAAASLYGSRAANGVIIITTKKGKAGKTAFNWKNSWGFSDMAITYRPVLNGEKRRRMLYLGLENYAINNNILNPTGYADKEIDKYAAKPWSGYTDWKDELFQKGFQQSYEFSASGGGEKTQFYSSLSYTKQEGITKSSSYERMTGMLNASHTAGVVTIDFKTMFAKSNQSQISEGTAYANPIMATAMSISPSDYPYNPDGSYSTSFPGANGANIVQTWDLNYDRNTLIRSLSTASVTWNIWDNLNLKGLLNYDFNQSNNRVWWDPRSNDGKASNGVFQRYMTNREKLSTQALLTYNKTFKTVHSIDALLGFETEDYTLDYVYANGNDYPGYLEEITNSANNRASSNKSKYRMTSMLARINYDYDSRYYASVSARRDGSSRLAKDSRWGNFWSVSGSWRITKERFAQPITHILTDAKLRLSYGISGTQPSDYYGYMGIYEYGNNYAGKPGASEARLPNTDLTWEKNNATNIGIDMTFISRFSLSFDWYNRKTTDLLFDKPISTTTGFGTVLSNVGAMRNRGFDIEISSTNIDNKVLLWTTTLNIGHNKNKITKLDGTQREMINPNYTQLIHRVGKPYYSFYGLEYAGVDPETGKESYYRNKGSNPREITTNPGDANFVIIGKAEPKVQGGITNFMTAYNFDFSFTFTYSLGGKAYDRARWIQSNGGNTNYFGNVPSYWNEKDMWKEPGDIAKLPQFVYGNTGATSSRWLLSTNHLRLKNMTFGYTLPRNILNKMRLNKLRAYMSSNNLLTFKSKNLYIDPEVPAHGLVTFETPALRTVTFGVEIGF